MKINIYVGSVHGTAQEVAAALAKELAAKHQINVFDPPQVADLQGDDADLLLFISSTTGQGELPDDMQMFVSESLDAMPLQTGKPYAIVGLGDSAFDDFCAAHHHLSQFAQELQAHNIGTDLKIDASEDFDANVPALAWLQSQLPIWEQTIGS